MGLVLDASIVACWILPDEQSTKADHALGLMECERAFVPSIFEYEIRNILTVNERRGRLTLEVSTAGLKFLSALPISVDPDLNADEALSLASKHRLTVYDAAYLELARRKSLPLATLDAALIAAANAEGVALI